MNQEHLAIASVPIQEWTKIYEPEEALFIGTIFSELDKPFFAAEEKKQTQCELSEEEKFLKKIQEVSFVLDDIRLFMDTHPENKNGLELLKNMLEQRKQLLKEFALKFYPLTVDCMMDIYMENPASDCYCWQRGPIPWEGVCV